MDGFCSTCHTNFSYDQGYSLCDCNIYGASYVERRTRIYCPTCGDEMYYDRGDYVCLSQHPKESDKEKSKQESTTIFKKYSEIIDPEIKDKLEKGIECSICVELITSIINTFFNHLKFSYFRRGCRESPLYTYFP